MRRLRLDLPPVPAALAERYRADGAWDDRSLGRLLDGALRAHPGRRVTIFSASRPYRGTAVAVHERAARFAGCLAGLGIGPGDPVAFQLPNWEEAAVVFYGCAMAGAVLVPVVHFYGPKELGFILAQSKARLLVTAGRFGSRDYLADLAALEGALPGLEHVVVVGGDGAADGIALDDLVARAEPLSAPVRLDPSDPALIAYTSGTTADPKGVVHTHRSLGFEVRQLAAHQSERVLPNLTGAPVGHAIGMLSGLLVPLLLGFDLYLTDVWDPTRVLDIMAREKISAGTGSTYFLTSLLDAPGFGPEHAALMGMIGLGGSPVPNAIADRAASLGISIVRAYGCTEHPSVTGSRHGDPASKRLYTDGRPLAGAEVCLRDEDGREVPAGSGQAGEIWTRGPDRCAGYTDPELTASAFDGAGWFRTGDVGIVDAEGFVTVTDRVKDIIIRGGENVSPAEVEQVLATMRGVGEVAVVAAPDARLGEHGCAFVRMQPGALEVTVETMRAHLAAAGLARQKWPEEVRVVAELPRTPSGKVRKVALRDQLREEAAAHPAPAGDHSSSTTRTDL